MAGHRRVSSRLPQTLVTWAVLALACSGKGGSAPSLQGSQTGDEGTSQYARLAGNASYACDFEESVFDESALTVFGVGMSELLSSFEPSAPVAFHWKDVAFGGGTFTHVPGPGSTTLRLEVSREGDDPIFEIRNKPFEGQGGLGRLCNDVFYEVPVTLRVSTADAALDEVVRTRSFELYPSGDDDPDLPAQIFPVVIRVLSPHSAYLQHRFDVANLAGSFELKSEDTTWEGAVLAANVWLYRGASTGRLELDLRRWQTNPAADPLCGSVDPCDSAPAPAEGAPTPSAPFAPEPTIYAATWPSALSCNNGMPPLPPEANLIGSSATEVTQLIPGAGALARSDDALSTLALDFAPLPAELCQGHAGTAVLFDANARLTESGLDFDLELPLQIVARLDAAGELGELITSRAGWELPITAAQLAEIGIELPAASEYEDLYLQFGARYTRQGDEWTASAELRVHGRNPDPECLRQAATALAEVTQSRPRSSQLLSACGRSDTAIGENGAIPTGMPLLHHTWSLGQ